MESAKLKNFLIHILTPVYRLTEDDTIRDAQMGTISYSLTISSSLFISSLVAEELKTTAVELQDLIQAKVGVTNFSTVYNQIRQSVLEVRRGRKVAKILQVSTNPAAAAKRKIHRNANKKVSRKRKERGLL